MASRAEPEKDIKQKYFQSLSLGGGGINTDIWFKTEHSRLREHLRKGGKNLRAGRWGRGHGLLLLGHAVLVLTSSRQPGLLTYDQIISNLRIYGADEFQAPPYTEELLSMDRAWGRRNTLLRMWPLVGIPCFGGWPHPHAHTGSTG